MAWLLRDGDVLAAVEVAESFGSRLRGLLGRDGIDGALLLRPAKSVHTLGMKFAIDVAFCDDSMRVLAVRTLRPYRMTSPRWKAKCVIEASAGAFERWGLRVGDQLEGAVVPLVLVATPIGNLGDLPPRAVDALRDADIVCCEDTRHSRKLLDHFGLSPRRLLAVHEHNEAESAARLVDEMVRDGARVAFITDAGTPGISDPGERLVAAALAAGVDVSVVPGPAALVAALVVSGLPTGRFCFEGFLPRKGKERAERLSALAAEDRTVVLYEAPHRLPQTVRDLAGACGGDRRIAIARELTKKFEDVWRGTLAEAVDRATAMEARGEHVLVVEGAPPIAAPSVSDLDAAVQRRLDAGLSTRDAAAEVAAALGVSKRLAYNAAVRLSR